MVFFQKHSQVNVAANTRNHACAARTIMVQNHRVCCVLGEVALGFLFPPLGAVQIAEALSGVGKLSRPATARQDGKGYKGAVISRPK
jgi:hypothetical protein